MKEPPRDYLEIVRDLRRHGFTQLRGTTHGILYGYEDLRFMVGNPSTAWQAIKNLKADWARVKKQLYEQYPEVKHRMLVGNPVPPPSEAPVVPIENPEDAIAEAAVRTVHLQGAEMVGDPQNQVLVNHAVGATVSGSVRGCDVVSDEVSEANDLETEINKAATDAKGEDDVTKHAKRKQVKHGKQCPVPKCDGIALGQHIAMHRRRGDWQREYDAVFEKTNKLRTAKKYGRAAGTSAKPAPKPSGSRQKAVVLPSAELANGLQDALDTIAKAFKDMEFERNYYRDAMKERDAMWAKLTDAVTNIQTGGVSDVRRKLS